MYVILLTNACLITNCVFCTSSRARKAYLVLTCGPPSAQTALPKGKGADGEMCSDNSDDSGDEESERVSWHKTYLKHILYTDEILIFAKLLYICLKFYIKT